jgi:hypothetical protein
VGEVSGLAAHTALGRPFAPATGTDVADALSQFSELLDNSRGVASKAGLHEK